jgi:hypothetical protein
MNATTVPALETVSVKVDFGTGILPSLAMEFYRDLGTQLQIPKAKAEKIARSFMSDYGRVMSEDADVSYKVSRANKDGMCNLSFAAKSLKKTTTTKSLSLARLCTQLYALRKEGLITAVTWEDVLPSDGDNSLYDYVNQL